MPLLRSPFSALRAISFALSSAARQNASHDAFMLEVSAAEPEL